jgi:hypothetical protein
MTHFDRRLRAVFLRLTASEPGGLRSRRAGRGVVAGVLGYCVFGASCRLAEVKELCERAGLAVVSSTRHQVIVLYSSTA